MLAVNITIFDEILNESLEILEKFVSDELFLLEKEEVNLLRPFLRIWRRRDDPFRLLDNRFFLIDLLFNRF
jgi:hypothetical protein